jgi:serine/threonine protein kinase
MSWPANTDYQESIQAPAICFKDVELKIGAVDTNKLGLPIPFAGNFAIVYKIRSAKQTYAVRCFLREYSDQHDRYIQISKHLQKTNLPYMVGFVFVTDGIRVKGRWCPILKMEWIHGEHLHTFVKRILSSPSKCTDLADKWLTLCKTLKQAGIAHGDLQHGNILIVNDNIRLIDYDGMFVPQLVNQSSHEVGHPNYQHPQRSSEHYGLYLDNFSAWVIYLSLVALSIDPTLWQKLDGGDECLLFRREDYLSPESSRAFSMLLNHQNIQIQTLTQVFRNLLYLDVAQIPAVEDQLSSLAPPMRRTETWEPDPIVPPVSPPEWIADNSPLTPLNFPASVIELRSLLIFSTLILGFFLWMVFVSFETSSFIAFGIILSILLPVNLLMFKYEYNHDPALKAKATKQQAYDLAKKETEARQQELFSAQYKHKMLRAGAVEHSKVIQRQIDDARTIEMRELSKCQLQQSHTTGSLAKHKHLVETNRNNALESIKNKCQLEINRIDAELASLSSKLIQEYRDINRTIQQRYIQDFLSKQYMMNATIKGVGESFKRNLIGAGFNSAADIDFTGVQRVIGIGINRAQSLMSWRKSMESIALSRLPRNLIAIAESNVNAKYASKQNELKKERTQWVSHLETETARISKQATIGLTELNNSISKSQADVDKCKEGIIGQTTDRIDSLNKKLHGVKDSYITNAKFVEAEVQQRSKVYYQCNWRFSRASREFMQYNGVNYSIFVKKVIFGR